VITSPIIINGTGNYFPTDSTEGSLVSNLTSDAETIVFDGTSGRVDRARINNVGIKHEAPTKYAVRLDFAPFFDADNLVIDCNSTGYGGILFGDELSVPVAQAYLGSMRNVRIQNYTNYGVRVNSTGTLWDFTGCQVSSTVDGSIGGYFNKEGVKVVGGQWGARNIGGIALSDFNNGTGDREGNTFEGQVFENVSNKCVSFDGDTRAVVTGVLRDCYANLISVSGVVCYFGRAKQCRLESPRIKNPTGGGTLCEWGENAIECVLECDIESAKAPVVVSPSAIRSEKIVTGVVRNSDIASITTSTNLKVVLRDGVDAAPAGFTPVHNGVAWNYQYISLSNDSATSYEPPSSLTRISIYRENAGKTTHWFEGIVDTGTNTISTIFAGTSFEVLSGPLNGLGGTNNFSAISADSGLIYVQARNGSSAFVITMVAVGG
jgi:hypothetical protein